MLTYCVASQKVQVNIALKSDVFLIPPVFVFLSGTSQQHLHKIVGMSPSPFPWISNAYRSRSCVYFSQKMESRLWKTKSKLLMKVRGGNFCWFTNRLKIRFYVWITWLVKYFLIPWKNKFHKTLFKVRCVNKYQIRNKTVGLTKLSESYSTQNYILPHLSPTGLFPPRSVDVCFSMEVITSNG